MRKNQKNYAEIYLLAERRNVVQRLGTKQNDKKHN